MAAAVKGDLNIHHLDLTPPAHKSTHDIHHITTTKAKKVGKENFSPTSPLTASPTENSPLKKPRKLVVTQKTVILAAAPKKILGNSTKQS